MQNMRENMQNLAQYALKYAAYMRSHAEMCEDVCALMLLGTE